MRDILSLTFQELKNDEFFSSLPSFRAKQIFSWLHNKRVSSFHEMMNLSKKLREELSEKFSINGVKLVRKLESKIDGTVKYLFSLNDNEFIETVLLKSDRGLSVCISTVFPVN